MWQYLVGCTVPRGPVMGCHVAPCYWLLYKTLLESTGFDPVTSTHDVQPLQSLHCQCATPYALIYVWFQIYLSLIFMYWRGGPGWGLAPAPGRIHCCNMTTCYAICARMIWFELVQRLYKRPATCSLTIGLWKRGPMFALARGHMGHTT
jgi:hypothetical protein